MKFEFCFMKSFGAIWNFLWNKIFMDFLKFFLKKKKKNEKNFAKMENFRLKKVVGIQRRRSAPVSAVRRPIPAFPCPPPAFPWAQQSLRCPIFHTTAIPPFRALM